MFGKKKDKNAPSDSADQKTEKAALKADKKAQKQAHQEEKKAAKQARKKAKADKKKGISPQDPAQPIDQEIDKTEKRKFFTLKKLLLIFALVAALAVSGAVVYKFYFEKKLDSSSSRPDYQEKELKHIDLPGEILKFSFEHFSEVYFILVEFNEEIIRIDREIERINAIAEKYPDQERIVTSEKRVWEKTREKGVDRFKKIQNEIKAVYVLFQVNRAAGIEKINEDVQDITTDAREALTPVADLTQRLKKQNKPDQGLIKETYLKFKKKFL
ncbi:MAG: hypothetical protein U9P10_02815 [Thermodesulfobacteriota bacterium]|nr:hypothetical protein [Thermodesulfobacteriota bacterium]